jgi:hypothetical protein
MTARRLALAAVALAVLLPPSPGVGQAGEKALPRLLLHDWFGKSPVASPTFVRDHLDFLESQPFDGIALYLRSPDLRVNVTIGVLSRDRLEGDDIDAVLRPVASLRFRRLVHNFAAVISRGPPDVFDDWDGVIRNFGLLAKAARAAHLEGVYLDNESYGSRWMDFPAGVTHPDRSLAAYQDQARLRGKQVMEAMTAAFPEVTVIVLHGPYISEPKAPHPLFPEWAAANRLSGPFFAGLAEGSGASATCVDGGELYGLRTPEDFEKSYQWRKSEFPSERVDPPYLSPALRARWSRTVQIAFGLYDRGVPGAGMDPATLRSLVERGLLRTDRYVWLYVEGPTFLLPPGQGGAPADWVSAVRDGRDAALRARGR